MATRPQRPKATRIQSNPLKRQSRESERLENEQKKLTFCNNQSEVDTATNNEQPRSIKSRSSAASRKTDTLSDRVSVELNSKKITKNNAVNAANDLNTFKELNGTSTDRLSKQSVTPRSKALVKTKGAGIPTTNESKEKLSSATSSVNRKRGLSDNQNDDIKSKLGGEMNHNGLPRHSTAKDDISKVSRPTKGFPVDLLNGTLKSDNGLVIDRKPPRASRQNSQQKTTANKSLKVMILNMKGRDDRNGAIAERRRHIFHNVIQKHLPGLVLVQDFKLPDITTKFWSKSPIPSQYAYIGTEDTGIMYDTSAVDIQDVPITEFRNTMDNLHRHSNNKLQRIVPIEFEPFTRMCARLVTIKQEASVHFICISWRGEFLLNSNKLKHTQKLEYFEYLMEFLRIIKEKLKLPILLGGNFYVDLYSIEHLVQPPFQLCIYDASMRRTVPGIIDFFVISEDLALTDITWVSLREDTTAYQPTGVMDHDPVKAVLTAKPGKGSGSKRMVNPNKWNPTKTTADKK